MNIPNNFFAYSAGNKLWTAVKQKDKYMNSQSFIAKLANKCCTSTNRTKIQGMKFPFLAWYTEYNYARENGTKNAENMIYLKGSKLLHKMVLAISRLILRQKYTMWQ